MRRSSSRWASGCRPEQGVGAPRADRRRIAGRLTFRHLLVMLPFAAAFAALPGALWIHIMVPALFLICSVGIVAMYADDIRVSRLRRYGLTPPDDPDLRRPCH